MGILPDRELCVGQVAAIFGIARSTASEHLSELRRAGLLAEGATVTTETTETSSSPISTSITDPQEDS